MKILRCYPNWYHNSILLDKCKYLSKALYGNSHTERQKGSQAPNSPEQIYFMCCLDLLFLWVVGSLQKNKKLMISMTGLTLDCVRITCKSWDILMQVQVMHTGTLFFRSLGFSDWKYTTLIRSFSIYSTNCSPQLVVFCRSLFFIF